MQQGARQQVPLLSGHGQQARYPRPVCGSKDNGKESGASPLEPAKTQQEPTIVLPQNTLNTPADFLNLAYESDKKQSSAAGAIKTTGLRRAPLSGGVKTATSRYDLPKPSVAVRNLVEISQFAHLCTVMSGMHHRRSGYPFGTLVDFAADGAGFPIFCLSPLAIHSRNLMEDPRCSLVVQMPGWTGLANARVTIFGDCYQLPADMQEVAREVFLAKQAPEKKEKWVFGNFIFFRMHKIVDIYFVGGFGTVQWIDVAEYMDSKPDPVASHKPQRTLQILTEKFSEDLKVFMSKPGNPVDDAAFIAIDASGVDVRLTYGRDFVIERIGFDTKVHSLDEAITALQRVMRP